MSEITTVATTPTPVPAEEEHPVQGEAARRPLRGMTGDANIPTLHSREATSEERWVDFGGLSRSVSIQNAGGNTLWVSLDKENWHYIMSGTSMGGTKASIPGFWYCTQTGRTRFVVSDVAM